MQLFGTHRYTIERDGRGFRWFYHGPQPSIVVPFDAETRILVTTQELPGHPSSRLFPGVPGPNVAPPGTIGSIFVRQEQPWHSVHPQSKFAWYQPDSPIEIEHVWGIVMGGS